MKMKHDKEYYLQRAVDGFRTLIIYQCVTRPQFDPAYKVNGRFSKEKLFEESEFFSKWESMGQQARRRYAKMYADYSKHHNLAFGLDCRLVEKILGSYRDEEGRQVRISIDEVLQNLKGWVKCTGNGTKTKKNKEGKAEVVCWWRKKYFIASKEYWLRLLDDPKYSDLEKYPRSSDGEIWALKQIWKYRKQTIPQKPREIEVEQKSSKPRRNYKERVAEGLSQEYIRGIMDMGTLQNELARAKFTQKENDEIVAKAVRERKARLANHKPQPETQPQPNPETASKVEKYHKLKKLFLSGGIEYDLFRKWMVANGVVKNVIAEWDNYELRKMNEIAQSKPVEVKKPEPKPINLDNIDLDELVKMVG